MGARRSSLIAPTTCRRSPAWSPKPDPTTAGELWPSLRSSINQSPMDWIDWGRRMQTTFTISTDGPGLYEFTRDVVEWAKGTGLLTLFIRHTTASLLIQENADPEVKSALTAYFNRLVPPSDDPAMSYLTHTYEGPDDMPAHQQLTK